MTSQEKAKELVDKYTQVIWDSGSVVTKPLCKECALIAVNEIIEEWQNVSDLHSIIVIDDNPTNVIDKVYYHQQVKTEIEKL